MNSYTNIATVNITVEIQDIQNNIFQITLKSPLLYHTKIFIHFKYARL